MYLQLQGITLSPVISKKTHFYFRGCKIELINPRRRQITKNTAGIPMYAYNYLGFEGTVLLTLWCKNRHKAKQKLNQLLEIESIGRYHSEGAGRIKWMRGQILKDLPSEKAKTYPRIRIRKGLPLKLPENIQFLIQYALLHDFFHTSKHLSKIYIEPELMSQQFVDLLRQHHEKREDSLIHTFQKYDHLAAMITRKFYSPKTNRYNWKATKKVDFEKLSKEIAEIAVNPWKLYSYIYASNELAILNESFKHGHTSLQNHLLIIANLIVQDFSQGRLKDFAHKRLEGRSGL